MLIQQIRNEMKMNGYTVPQKTRKSPFVIGGIRLTEDSLQSSMQTCFGGAEGVVCYPRVPPPVFCTLRCSRFGVNGNHIILEKNVIRITFF